MTKNQNKIFCINNLKGKRLGTVEIPADANNSRGSQLLQEGIIQIVASSFEKRFQVELLGRSEPLYFQIVNNQICWEKPTK